MPDLKSFASKTAPKAVIIKEYISEENSKYFGFRNIIKWDYEKNRDIIGFNVYRAIASQPLLEKKYEISMPVFEKFGSLRSIPTKNTSLFFKGAFSQNSNVKFLDSNSNRFDKKELPISTYNFKKIYFSRTNKNGQYSFTDKNIKFGETYVYVISAMNRFLREGGKSKPVLINVESIDHPRKPDSVKAVVSSQGVLFTIESRDKSVAFFNVYRKSSNEGEFSFLHKVKAVEGFCVNFLDADILPGIEYDYRIYSVDLFGDISFDSFKLTAGDATFFRKGVIPIPEFSIFVENNTVIFEGIKNSNSIIGYRLERQDVWRNEKGFNIKTFNEVKWPNVIFFNDKIAKQEDRSVFKDKIYKYRITSIKKNGNDGAYFVTPYFAIKDKNRFDRIIEKIDIDSLFKVKDFSAKILDKKRSPIILKINWTFEGNWDYANIQIAEQNYRVENLHNVFYLSGLDKDKSYTISVKVFNSNDILLNEQRASIKT